MKETNIKDAIAAFGLISVVFLGFNNLICLIWTISLTYEQFNTFWGYGTSIEMGVILVYMAHLVAISGLILTIVYFVCYALKKTGKKVFILNVVLFIVLLLQVIVTNIFIYY